MSICPRPASTPGTPGDANGDGVADIADAVVILRARTDGGPEPACPAAIDLIPDERVELDDAFSLLLALYEGGFALPEEPDCGGSTALAVPGCMDLALGIEAPETHGGEVFTARVALTAPVAAVEAWSLAIEAHGCGITAVTTAGTEAASSSDPAGPGLRQQGYEASFTSDGDAVSTVVLGFMERVALPTGSSTLLSIEVQPEGGDCTLSLDAPVTGLGLPVESVLVVDGAAFPIPATSFTIHL